MAVEFAWGQISAATVLGGAVGLWLGHRLAIGRDKRKEFAEAGKQFREPFVQVKRLLAVSHPNHIGGEDFQKVASLLPKHYNTLCEARMRFEPHLSQRKLRQFREKWDEFCCVRGQPAYPTFEDYKSSDDHMEELAKRKLAIARIDTLFGFTK